MRGPAPDTARIQAALNAYAGTNGATVLAPDGTDGTDTAFLSAPLTIGNRQFPAVSTDMPLTDPVKEHHYFTNGGGLTV